MGFLIFKLIGLKEDNIYTLLSRPILGLLSFSILVQVMSFYDFINFINFLVYLNYLILFIGLINLFINKSTLITFLIFIKKNRTTWVLLGIVSVGLLISMAPLTKHDEIFYHALLPLRIIQDNYLHFYTWPFEGAILPQMFFQISMTPLMAWGHPNAGNIIGYFYSIMIIIYIFYTINMYTENKKFSTWVTLFSIIGLHTFVFHVTMGGHAFGELSLLLLLGVIFLEKNMTNIKIKSFLVAVLSIAVVGSKLSYLPLIFFIVLYFICKEKLLTLNFKLSNSLFLLSPFLIIYLPILVYTYIQSGSPFGPVLAGVIDTSPYNMDEIELAINRYSVKLPYLNIPISEFLRIMIFDYSLIVIISLTLFLLKFRKKYFVLWLLVLLQIGVIYFKLVHDIRFMGSILYFITMIVALDLYYEDKFNAYSKSLYKIAYILAIGYIGILLLYSVRFLPISLGLETKEHFFKNNVPLYEDYKKIDTLLPEDSIILAPYTEGSLNGSYMPRQTIYTISDFWWKDGRSLYLFTSSDFKNGEYYEDFIIKNKIYENNHAIVTVFRTPFKSPKVSNMFLYELVEK